MQPLSALVSCVVEPPNTGVKVGSKGNPGQVDAANCACSLIHSGPMGHESGNIDPEGDNIKPGNARPAQSKEERGPEEV